MKTINQKYQINAPIEKVWRALVHPDEIEKWGGGPTVMDDKEGTKFRLWGGDIHGTNKEVVEEEKLVQEWYGGKWKEPSMATFALIPENDGTLLELLHENVPDKEAKDIEQGWKDYYLGPLKDYLEKEQ